MNNIKKISAIVLLICVVLTSLVACGDKPAGNGGGKGDFIDYASQVKLDLNGANKTVEVKVKQLIDGDTTHFYIDDSSFDGDVIKARYLAVNTPESTGQIEEWGKTASNFTKEKLSNAKSIVIESEDSGWNADSTGERYLLWIWYQTEEGGEYRNLNLELLQEGLAIASATSSTKYGDLGIKAIDQAKAHKKHIYSGEKDPNFYYGGCIELTLKELRANPEKYQNKTVAFTGVITKNKGQQVYVEAYDEETNMYHGIAVYYGFSVKYGLADILQPGNKVRIVGSMQYYEAGDSYQIADLDYDMMNPTDQSKVMLIENGAKAAFVETSAEKFAKGKVEVTVIENEEEKIKEYDYADLAIGSTISMKDLTVKSVYTTNNGGDNDGAMTLTCRSGNTQITVRTVVLTDKNGKVVKADSFEGKTIDVKGVVDTYDGDCQIILLSMDDVKFH
ncbi:MAG: thermonuclease family protein [Clostridia bacterium]|nr:thermonuclease family protein [Clostridia bacterium]